MGEQYSFCGDLILLTAAIFHADPILTPPPTPEFLTTSATKSRMEILTSENLVGVKTAPTAVSRAFTPLVRRFDYQGFSSPTHNQMKNCWMLGVGGQIEILVKGRHFPVGWGVFHVKWWVSKGLARPSKPRKNKHFWRDDIPGKLLGFPGNSGRPESLRTSSLCSVLVPVLDVTGQFLGESSSVAILLILPFLE